MLRARICIWASLSYLSVKFIIKLIIVRWEAQPGHITAISKNLYIRCVSGTANSCKSITTPQKCNTILSWLSLNKWEKYPKGNSVSLKLTICLLSICINEAESWGPKDSASVDKAIAERVTLCWLIECVKKWEAQQLTP